MNVAFCFRLTPAKIVLRGFLALILFGTCLLMLPAASVQPGGAGFLTAFFTATSATCVTGLIVLDTATGWTLFGQLVILTLSLIHIWQINSVRSVSFTE